MAITNIEIAAQYQQKFDFYLVALVLTILALAIQTASFGEYIYADIIEIIGWVSLLLSGFLGLLRIESLPVLYRNKSLLDEKKKELNRLRDLREGGHSVLLNPESREEVSIESEISVFKKSIEHGEPVLSEFEKKLIPRYRLFKRFLYLGIVSIAVSRAVPGLSGIYEYFR